MILRIFTGLAIVIAVYVALAFEATTGGRTLLPHGPAMLLVLAAWCLPATPAVLVGAVIGFACDAIGMGALGPGVIAAVLVAAIAGGLRRRWELESLLAVVLFGAGVSLAFLIGAALIAERVVENAVRVSPLELLAGRAVATALAAMGLILLARFVVRATSGIAAVVMSR